MDIIEAFSLNLLIPFDSDGDGDVDLLDVASFSGCLGGPLAPAAGACTVHDVNADNRIDERDFAGLQNAFTGSL